MTAHNCGDMNKASPYRIIKTLTIYYILIWINLLDGQPLSRATKNHQNQTECASEFDINVQQCIDGLYFYKWKADVIKFHTSGSHFKEIFKHFFCRQYTSSLQCIHEILNSCKGDNNSQTVRKYLRQPWAQQYNTFCDINQQNSTTIVQNNSSKLRNVISIKKPRKNENDFASTENQRSHENSRPKSYVFTSTIDSFQNSTSEIERLAELQDRTDSDSNNNHLITRNVSHQQNAGRNENGKKTLAKGTLFFSESSKTEKGFNDKIYTEEQEFLLRKLKQ